MVDINYTPIDYLIKNYQATSSNVLKESEPVAMAPENYEIKEDEEHKVEEEVRPYIEIKPASINLPPDLKKMGVQSVPTSQENQNYQNIKTPIEDEKVIVGLHAPLNSSLRWLATLAIYILRKAHLGLKKIGGHVIRVVVR